VDERVGIRDGVRNKGDRVIGVGSEEGVVGYKGECAARGEGDTRVDGSGDI